MTKKTWTAFALGVIATTALFALVATPRTTVHADDQPDGQALFEMMQKAKRYTEPSAMHKVLERFIGTWETKTSFVMAGQKTPPEPGVAKIDWLMEGRWLKVESKGSLMGRPIDGFSIMGYDNFKMSFVTTAVQTMDTSMVRMEGDLDPGGDMLIMYGTLDEYTTGEHDKMVKQVWRIESKDRMVVEIHDLPIGAKNTQVVDVTYTRKK